MKSLEEQLKEYRMKTVITPQENKVEQTVVQSKKVFYEKSQERKSSYFEFLYQQAGYIQKRWWIFQMCILLVLWWVIHSAESNFYVERSMGVLAAVFVIMVIPELWKNRRFSSMEIEGAAFFSLQQIYTARMFLFAIVDVLLLSVFWGIVSFTVEMKVSEMLLQFFLPMVVTCCICFRTLCSRHWSSEYCAVALSILWVAVWALIILKDSIYTAISVPAWIGISCFAVIYLAYAVGRVLKSCGDYWEVNISWN